ncbi:DUF6683 family protein [Sphingobium scionense]
MFSRPSLLFHCLRRRRRAGLEQSRGIRGDESGPCHDAAAHDCQSGRGRRKRSARHAPAPARMDATYRVDPNVRRTVQQKLVAAVTRQNEAAGEELSATFARHDLIAMGDRALSSFGLRSGDVIDAVTIYRLAMWGAAKGLTTPPPRSAITGARMQTASTFDLAAARLDTPARRQEFAETLLYQAILMDLASEQAQKSRDQVTIDALGRSARQALVASGLNPDRMQLTSRGFILER